MILFDESHEEFCSVSGKKKRKPYTRWAQEVCGVEVCLERKDFIKMLGKSSSLVVAEPHLYFSRSEIRGVLDFAEEGGGLILLGNRSNTTRYYAYGCNEVLNPISTLFGMRFNADEVIFEGENVVSDFIAHPIFQDVSSFHYRRGCSLSLSKNEEGTLAAFARNARSVLYPSRPPVACIAGRVFAIGDSSVWSNPRDPITRDDFRFARNVARFCAKA